MHTHSTTGPPNIKAGGLDSNWSRGSERTFWKSLDKAMLWRVCEGYRPEVGRHSGVGGHGEDREPGPPWSSGLSLGIHVLCVTKMRGESGEGN